jgi:hypothetical protein
MGVKRHTQAVIKRKRVVTSTLISGGHRRKVRLTRYSSKEPDETISADVLGGKIPIDCLVRAKILRDDDRIWLEREGHWKPAPPSKGRVVIEVLDLSPETDTRKDTDHRQ